MILPVVVCTPPMTPPTQYELVSEPTIYDTWRGSDPDMPSKLFVRSFRVARSSSSREGTLENLLQTGLESPILTASGTGFAELPADLCQAERRSASVVKENAAENVFELRRLTGFTWERLADLLNVDRRTLYNWVNGGEVRKANQEHIAKTLTVIRFADRGSAEANATAIAERSSADMTPYNAIKAGLYPDARQYLSHGQSRSRPAQSASHWASWIGDFQSMSIHEGADGSETIEPLPYESKPRSRKKRIKRV